MNEPKIYGLIIPEVQAPEEYVLGGSELPKFELQPDGQWEKWLPPEETQNRYVEPANCTSYGTLSAVEMLLRRKYDYRDDFSERGLGILAGTWPPGNDPHFVCETLRKKGAFAESLLPYVAEIDTLEKYYSPKPLPADLTAEAQKFIEKYAYGHEWVFLKTVSLPEKQKRLKEALRYSPISVSVYAWEVEGDYYVKPAGARDNHWTVIYGYSEGKCWYVFDSYDQTCKQLAWDYNFDIAKRHHIELKGPPPTLAERNALLQTLSKLWEQLLALLTPAMAHNELAETSPELVEPEPVPEAPKSRLNELALAIRAMEGWYVGSRSWRNNNPGNLKFTLYTKSLGAVRSDAGGFAVFLTPDAGLEALKEMLGHIAESLLRAYPKDCDLAGFCRVYAPSFDANDPIAYARFLAKELGVPTSTKIKELA